MSIVAPESAVEKPGNLNNDLVDCQVVGELRENIQPDIEQLLDDSGYNAFEFDHAIAQFSSVSIKHFSDKKSRTKVLTTNNFIH